MEKAELRCTTMTNGEQYVMMTGTWLMPPWFVANLDTGAIGATTNSFFEEVIIIIFTFNNATLTAANNVSIC